MSSSRIVGHTASCSNALRTVLASLTGGGGPSRGFKHLPAQLHTLAQALHLSFHSRFSEESPPLRWRPKTLATLAIIPPLFNIGGVAVGVIPPLFNRHHVVPVSSHSQLLHDVLICHASNSRLMLEHSFERSILNLKQFRLKIV